MGVIDHWASIEFGEGLYGMFHVKHSCRTILYGVRADFAGLFTVSFRKRLQRTYSGDVRFRAAAEVADPKGLRLLRCRARAFRFHA